VEEAQSLRGVGFSSGEIGDDISNERMRAIEFARVDPSVNSGSGGQVGGFSRPQHRGRFVEVRGAVGPRVRWRHEPQG
jgi:hypothetical protein